MRRPRLARDFMLASMALQLEAEQDARDRARSKP